MTGLVKICGVTERAGMEAALRHGADMIGLVFRDGSSRNVGFEAAERFSQLARGRARIVAVIVDRKDDFLEKLCSDVNPDLIQLHGSETPHRTAEISARFARPVIKALGIGEKNDLQNLTAYAPLCERILVEAKRADGCPEGGSGRAFDWHLLHALERRNHLLLAGGLTPDNIIEAVRISGVSAVDVSSGVESTPGVKDEGKVRSFIQSAREAFVKTPEQKIFA